ncbi:MAG: flagellar hook protein FlgE [Spirochaetes bacterium]|nr:flagellar hook protein FlgE [Spirochaetota bacterium]
MMRSLFSGVSGLNNHQLRMDVVGNNIANVNTTGFKRGRVNFEDLLSQSLAGASRPTDVKGGVNPKQVGLGMMIGSIDTIHTQGALQTTGVNTDLAIMGEGFFVERFGEKTIYSRNGAFGLDRDGFLVNPANGFRVQGFRAVQNPDGSVAIDTQADLKDVIIPVGAKDPAKMTKIVNYHSNLNALTPVLPPNANEAQQIEGSWRTSINVVDSRGQTQEVAITFRKFVDPNTNQAVDNRWRASVTVVDADKRTVGAVQAKVNAQNDAATNEFIVQFNRAGAMESIVDGTVAPGAQATPLQGANQKMDVNLSYTIAGSEPMALTLALGTAGLYDGITQFASQSSTKAYFQDGRKMGYLEGFQIDDSGVITGSYTNGTSRPLGRVAVSTFTNPGGLTKVGESYFSESNNSGRAMIHGPGEVNAGSVRAGTVEMSNVDMANELTDMIITQRGFQVNSRTITTADTLLEELLRLKR